MSQSVFGFLDAADDGALQAGGVGSFDVQQVVVEEEDAGGVAAERADDVIESVAVGFDPAGQVRDEAVLEERAEAELVFDPGPVQ